MKPLVFIIDIDGTIIGNITNQIMIYELKYENVNIKYSLKDLFNKFDQGLIRPYFDTFVKNTKRRLPHAEFFFYTASDDRWGAFIAGAIEKYYKLQFNRPIFTRKHCFHTDMDLKKSLKHVTPMIQKSLQKNYGKNIDLTNRVLIVDNNMVYQSNEKNSVLVCPTYNVSIAENLPVFINEEMFNAHKHIIEKKLKRYIPAITTVTSYIDFQKQFYAYYIQELSLIKPQDRFWFFLNRLLEIKNITIFTPKAVEYINMKLNKRL